MNNFEGGIILTKIIRDVNDESLLEAAKAVKNGGLVAFPTETVYGLGANAFLESGVKKIFEAKGRPSDNPLIVHISDMEQVNMLACHVGENAKKIMGAFMPGPITVILKKNDLIPACVTAGLDSVGIRFPKHPIAQRLISLAAVPIAAPSANLSGKPSPTVVEHVIEDMQGRVDYIIDGGACEAGVESTIVDCTAEIPMILRPGIITLEDLQEIVPKTVADEHILSSLKPNEHPRCPGMKYKHYAPKADVTVVEGEKNKAFIRINQLIEENKDKKIGILASSDNCYDGCMILRVEDNVEYAHSLFYNLRKFDEMKADVVFAEFCIFDKYDMSVKNRLYKSAGGQVIYV